MKQLTPKAFADYLAEAAEKIRQDGFSIVKDKPINYGQQIAVQFCEAKASVNIYNGKKGLTHVYNGDSALKQRLMLGWRECRMRLRSCSLQPQEQQ